MQQYLAIKRDDWLGTHSGRDDPGNHAQGEKPGEPVPTEYPEQENPDTESHSAVARGWGGGKRGAIKEQARTGFPLAPQLLNRPKPPPETHGAGAVTTPQQTCFQKSKQPSPVSNSTFFAGYRHLQILKTGF